MPSKAAELSAQELLVGIALRRYVIADDIAEVTALYESRSELSRLAAEREADKADWLGRNLTDAEAEVMFGRVLRKLGADWCRKFLNEYSPEPNQ